MSMKLFYPALLLTIAHPLSAADEVQVALNAGSVFQDCSDCPAVAVIPSGTFDMGFDGGEEGRYEGPVREVHIARPFAAGVYPVTNAEYSRFLESSGRDTGTGCNFWDFESRELIRLESSSWRDPGHGRPIRDDEPVVCVSWHDSKAYVSWLSDETGKPYRLLTEAEWEYVARGGSSTEYPWGDDANAACDHANVADLALIDTVSADDIKWSHVNCNDGYSGLAPVGSFTPNSFGVYDMIGNSWEWVEDCYLVPYPDGPLDGTAAQASGTCELRSVRGGSWITSPFRQRPSWRGRDPEDKLSFIFGFRVARDLP